MRIIRAPGGDVNPAATLGSNMYDGARAQSTFLTRRRSRKVSTSPQHDQQSLPFSETLIAKPGKSSQSSVTLSFLCVLPRGGDITGAYSLQEKVIINHIYDAVREPT
jgi:hypothetical protein